MFVMERTFSLRSNSRRRKRNPSLEQEETEPPPLEAEFDDPELQQFHEDEKEPEILQIKEEDGELKFQEVLKEEEDSENAEIKEETSTFSCEDTLLITPRQENDALLQTTQEMPDNRAVQVGPLEVRKTTRKRNFTDSEIEVLVGEVDARKIILFGGHSSGITNKRKISEWQHVVSAVNSVSATERSVAEVKKKWFDMKVEAKKRVARLSHVSGGQDMPKPTPLDAKIASISGTAGVSDVVSVREGDTGLAETTAETVSLDLEAVGDGELPSILHSGTVTASPAVPSTVTESPSVPSTVTASPSVPSTVTARPAVPNINAHRVPGTPGSGRVLTDAVLQTQRDTITAINEVRDELQQMRTVMSNICGVLSEIAGAIKDAAKK